jgi:hypothetical protein
MLAGAIVATMIAPAAASGERVWNRRYDGPAGGEDIARDTVVSADGTTVFVVGESDGGATTHDNSPPAPTTRRPATGCGPHGTTVPRASTTRVSRSRRALTVRACS